MLPLSVYYIEAYDRHTAPTKHQLYTWTIYYCKDFRLLAKSAALTTAKAKSPSPISHPEKGHYTQNK